MNLGRKPLLLWLAGSILALTVFAIVVPGPGIPQDLGRHRLDQVSLLALHDLPADDIRLLIHLGSMVEGGDGTWRSLDGPKRPLAAILTFELQHGIMDLRSYVAMPAVTARPMPTFTEVAGAYRECGAKAAADRLAEAAALQAAGGLDTPAGDALDRQVHAAAREARPILRRFIAVHADELTQER